jgi:hypothetical protein
MKNSDQAKQPMPRIELAPADYCDPVIEAFKKDVDRTLLRENLKLSVEERLRKADRVHASVAAWREAGKQLLPQRKTETQ